MLPWFRYCKWRTLADNSFATGYKRYEIDSVNKVYKQKYFNGARTAGCYVFRQVLRVWRPV